MRWVKDSVLLVIRGQLKGSTKAFIGLIIAFPTLMQIDAVKNFVTPLAAAHPKLATAIGGITLLGTLMHTPVIQAIFAEKTVAIVEKPADTAQ